MNITFLGHAGFCVESNDVILIMDPWLSTSGAYDSAWFQFPCNHHLSNFVDEKLKESKKEKFIYISHEHKDHLDLNFLTTIKNNDFTFIVGDFRRNMLKQLLNNIDSKGIIACNDKEKISIPGGYLQLFLDDTELNRDSAILTNIKGQSFLNFNDCKKLDEIYNIKEHTVNINVFTCQYSGATWHPTCYEYPENIYESISRKKMYGKFESVARAIEATSPAIYFPSAGPPCFLDPLLFHINFQEINIFPKQDKLIDYLNKRLNGKYLIENMFPGDSIDTESNSIRHASTEIVNEENYKEYLNSYASRYSKYFSGRKNEFNTNKAKHVLYRLKTELEHKMDNFSLSSRINVPLYFKLTDYKNQILKVCFSKSEIEYRTAIEEDNFYSISAPAYEVERVLNGILTWDDFSLTFRMRLNRSPDIYQKIIEAFLVLEKEDLNEFCKKLLDIESMNERIIIEAGGCRYSINRFCPHEGGDLKQSWIEEDRYVVCPRHTYKYDLFNNGKCTTTDLSINAINLEND